MIATVVENSLAVTHSAIEDREFLSFKIDGWEDASKWVRKVLLYEGREFVWSCWNSDRNTCHFVRLFNGGTVVARIRQY